MEVQYIMFLMWCRDLCQSFNVYILLYTLVLAIYTRAKCTYEEIRGLGFSNAFCLQFEKFHRIQLGKGRVLY